MQLAAWGIMVDLVARETLQHPWPSMRTDQGGTDSSSKRGRERGEEKGVPPAWVTNYRLVISIDYLLGNLPTLHMALDPRAS